MSTLLRSGCLLLVILGLPGVGPPRTALLRFSRKWDRNNDGKLTAGKFPGRRGEISASDRDRNGFIS
ncbi:MAG: hypothetical protein Ct9H300mP1_37490 [Planctomycetaceae bacterium]|nr:MAG: hypothetical protein Ct9H300mP1_37490 [Planctomycetaceae bacterium]